MSYLMSNETPAKRLVLVENESDSKVYIREFSGRITKARWKAIQRYCRRNTWRISCGCERDCCGCQFAQYMSATYRRNQVIVRVTKCYNY